MGLFTVLSNDNSTTTTTTGKTSSGTIPTVVQLYTDEPVQLEATSVLTPYASLTYQAIQIGDEEEDIKNRHQTPDLGIWNCRANELVDSMLATLANKVCVYCLTVDLSQPNQVEPSLTFLQNTLTRHLIQHPPPPPSDTPETPERLTATTSLYNLQTVEFGKANDDPKQPRSVNETFQGITTTLMICAKLNPVGEDQPEGDESYKLKQAQALVIYHLRKFAAALNCTLCFVQPPALQPNESTTAQDTETTVASIQPTVDYNTLSGWWRDLALDRQIWESSSSLNEETKDENKQEPEELAPETVEVASPLYGPGKHQEDLIESVVLRSAHYPGHWDANKDSLWVALPAPKDEKKVETPKPSGDEGWLSQLRESIASAQDLPPPIASPEKVELDDKKKDGKDAEVSDFFASLLKKP